MNYKLLSNYLLDPLKVKVLQIQKGVSGADLARKLGVHPVVISSHINGKSRNPKIQEAIAKALGVPLVDIAIESPKRRMPGRQHAA